MALDPRARSSRVTRRTSKPRKRQQTLDEVYERSAPAPRPTRREVPVRTAAARREERVLRQQVRSEVKKVRSGRGPRVDSGDVLRNATVAARRRLEEQAPTRTVTARGRRTTVDTGDILAGHDVREPREAPSFGEALRQELSGRGVLAQALSALTPSGEPVEIEVDGRTYRPKETTAGIPGAPAVGDRGKRFISDAVSLPKDAVQSLYEIGASGVEAAGGDTARGEKLLGGLDEGVLGRLLLHGDPGGALKALDEHPLFGALELTGAGQVAGRGAGAVARSGVTGSRAKRAAGTKRAPLRVEGTNQQLERRYSPNVLVKALQVAVEADQRKRGLDPDVARGSKRSRLLNAEVDEFAAQAEGTRRRGREEASRVGARIAPVRSGDVYGSRVERAQARVDRGRSRAAEASSLPGVRGRAERDVVLAAVEGRLRGPKTYHEDLLRERSRLQRTYLAERKQMSAGARRANRAQVRSLDRVLNDPAALRNSAEVFRAADDYNSVAAPIERALIAKGALHPEQADTARLRTYGVSVMGLRPAPKGARGLVDDDGQPVSTAQIKAHIAAHGNREPGFVGQRRSDRGASSFFVNWYGGRKTVDSKTRTGEAARTGGYDASFGALEEHLVRGRGVVDAIGTFDDFVGRMGARRRDGKPYTYDEAVRAAEEMTEATGMSWLPVRAVPARYDEATREAVLDAQGTAAVPQHLESLTLGRLDDSLKPPVDGKERAARNVVLVPAQQVQRFASHQTQGSSTGAKLGQAATRMFRNTVLPFSTKWLVGNPAEATLRSAFHGIGPGDVVRGGRVMRSLRGLDEQAWKAADTRIRGGLLFGSADRLNVRRGPEDFQGTVFESPAKAAAFAARLPVIRQTIGGLGVYTRSVFALNRSIERMYQQGVIGKQARLDAQELTGSWGKAMLMQKDVAQEVARGLLGTPKQVQYARAADEVLGKYGRFSPGTRRVIQSYAPFLPWFLNAARFVGYSLPARHPAKTALLANVELTLQDELEAHRKTVPPGDLESAIPLKDGGLLNLARYTPFGAFTKGAEGLADPLLPQIDSAVMALKGMSFTGKPLRTEDGSDPKRLWLALYTLAEGAVPGVQIARRVREKGATPFDNSTVWDPKTKPGTARSGAADRILNPLRPTYLSGGAASSLEGLSPAMRRRAERVAKGAGSSGREAAMKRRMKRLGIEP